MKKLISIILMISMIFSAALLSSCGEKDEKKDDETKVTDGIDHTDDKKGIKVGIITQVENGAFVDMKDGIIAGLEKAGYTEDNSVIDYKCAQNDATVLSTICASMDDGSYDAVFTVATPATQAFVNLESDTPNFFCAVSSPVAAGVVSDMESPDKNSTGTSNAIPTSDIFELAAKLTPDVKKFGIIYSTATASATATANSAIEYLESADINYTVKTVDTSDDVASVTDALIKDGAEALFIPNDAVVQAGISALVDICNEEKIPTYCSSATTVASGCFATLAIDDKGIGQKTAEMALKYLEDGTKVENIPSVVVGVDYCTVNENVAGILNISVPEESDIGYKVNKISK